MPVTSKETLGSYTALDHETPDQFRERMVAKAIEEDFGITSIDGATCHWRKTVHEFTPPVKDD